MKTLIALYFVLLSCGAKQTLASDQAISRKDVQIIIVPKEQNKAIEFDLHNDQLDKANSILLFDNSGNLLCIEEYSVAKPLKSVSMLVSPDIKGKISAYIKLDSGKTKLVTAVL